jgi:alpha,alpha-trehalose phosphorylase (configuration-retaining)
MVLKNLQKLNYPGLSTSYAGIVLQKKGFHICFKNKEGGKAFYDFVEYKNEKPDTISKWISAYSKKHRIKAIAAGMEKSELMNGLGSALWLKNDIVPLVFQPSKGGIKTRCLKLCESAMAEFDSGNLARIRTGSINSIKAAKLTNLSEYNNIAEAQEFNVLLAVAEKFRENDLSIIFFNSTAAGGGVALMRHALIRLYDLLGVQAKWHVMESDESIFEITKKKFHNILHGVARQEIKLTAKDKKFYNDWIRRNAENFEPVFKNTDVVVIDDPQPSGLISYIKKTSPKTKIIYRSHIELRSDLIDGGSSQQKATWDFIWKNIKLADLFISHPIDNFVPAVVPENKLVYMPAATDLLDGLNKKPSKEQMKYYFGIFNQILKNNSQTPLDLKRPYIVQIARFDPSKGIPHVIESFKKLHEKMKKEGNKKLPQLVIAGNGAVDDPEGSSLFAETIQMLNIDTYKDIKDDIKVARLPHNDQLLNAILRGSVLALQLSLREGFEVKVTEALEKGKPVIAYRTGGIPLQISHGKTGYLVDLGNTSKVAQYAYKLLIDKNLYEKMSQAATEKINHDYFTIANASKWLYLSLCLHYGILPPVKHPNIKSVSGSLKAFKNIPPH